MQTIPARWWRPGRNGRTPRLIVVHCTVSPEMGTGAEAVARYFASTDRPGSTQLVSDNNSTVRCVADKNTCYGAAGANMDGLHIELVGMPDQTAAQWTDAYSLAELAEAGPHIRKWSEEYDIPLWWLSVAQVAGGVTKGLCTHHDVSRAFPAMSTGHWDPGPNFPKIRALSIWRPQPVPSPAPRPKDDDMFYYDHKGTLVQVVGGKRVRITGQQYAERCRNRPEYVGEVDAAMNTTYTNAFGALVT